MKTTITVGQSVQVFETGKPERWNKVTVSREYEGDIDEQLEIKNVLKVVTDAHDKYSQSFVEPGSIIKKVFAKSIPDAAVRLVYAKAVAANDKEKVDSLESIYEFKIG
jgi:hypothetical protein